MARRILLERTLERLLHQACWGVQRCAVGALSLEFGRPRPEVRPPREVREAAPVERRFLARPRVAVYGQWHLWLYGGDWSIWCEDRQLAGTRSGPRRLDRALARLNGRKLRRLELDPLAAEALFEFEDGLRIESRRKRGGRKQELWLLFEPRGQVVRFRSDGRWLRQRAAARSLARWRRAKKKFVLGW